MKQNISDMQKKKRSIVEMPDEDALAQAVKDVSDGVKKMMSGRLNRKALLVLISHASSVSQNTVGHVLDAMADLERKYLK